MPPLRWDQRLSEILGFIDRKEWWEIKHEDAKVLLVSRLEGGPALQVPSQKYGNWVNKYEPHVFFVGSDRQDAGDIAESREHLQKISISGSNSHTVTQFGDGIAVVRASCSRRGEGWKVGQWQLALLPGHPDYESDYFRGMELKQVRATGRDQALCRNFGPKLVHSVRMRPLISELHYLTTIPAARAHALLRNGASIHSAAAPGNPTPLSLARELHAKGEAAEGSAAALVLEWSRRPLVLAMGTHTRLGASSPLRHLAGEHDVLRMIMLKERTAGDSFKDTLEATLAQERAQMEANAVEAAAALQAQVDETVAHLEAELAESAQLAASDRM